MTTRVRQSSPDCTRIAVLGLLCRHGPSHGYELRKLIEAQHLDRISNVQFGSIYSVLNRLERDGLVEALTTESVGRGPARTTYAVTASGKAALRDLLEGAFVNASQPERPIDLAIHFSGLLPLEDVISLIERRLEALETYGLLLNRLVRSTIHPDPAAGELIRDIGEHFSMVNRTERDWTTRVLERARGGGYRTGSVELDT